MKKQVLRIISVVLAVSLLSGMFSCVAYASEPEEFVNSSRLYGCYSQVQSINIGEFEYGGFCCLPWGIYGIWIIGYYGNDSIVEIPEKLIDDSPVHLVALSDFPKNTVFDKIVIPSTVTRFFSFKPSANDGDFYCKQYECDENNKFFRSVDGVLYTKDMKTLILYPNARENKEFVLPDSVETIYDYAFSNSKYLEKITLNRNVRIGTGAFFNCSNLKKVKSQPIYPSFYYRGCFYGCNSVYGAFGLLIKAENIDLPEGWENTTHIGFLEDPGMHSALATTAKVINTFAARFKRRFSTSKSSSGSSAGDEGNSLIIDICVAVIEIIEAFLPWLN